MKKIAALLLVILIVGAGAALVLYINLGAVAKTAIVSALSYVLDTEVTLEKVDLSLSEGRVTLYDLAIKNPQGFSDGDALRFGTIAVELDIATVTAELPNITLISSNGPAITLNLNKGASNLQTLVDNASRFDSGGEEASDPYATLPLRIEKLLLTGGSASVTSSILPTAITFDLADIEMTDIGTEHEPATIAQASSMFIKKVLIAAIKGSRGKLPGELSTILDGDIGETVTELKEKAGQAVEGVKDRVKGLFNRRK